MQALQSGFKAPGNFSRLISDLLISRLIFLAVLTAF